jgi:hypothetical protein
MRITKASAGAVKYACLYFHYAKKVPVYSYAYNIYNDNDEWCGCILFGLGANNRMAMALNCIVGTCLELQRVALNGKQGHNATSKAVGMAMRQVKQDAVYLKCLFSYADTKQKHIGIIYQATNWIYIGESESYEYEKDGQRYHGRTVSQLKDRLNKKYTCGELGFKLVKSMNKYIYIYAFDKKLRRQILIKQKSYPKRNDT